MNPTPSEEQLRLQIAEFLSVRSRKLIDDEIDKLFFGVIEAEYRVVDLPLLPERASSASPQD